MEEQEEKQTKKRGRPRNANFLSFDEAREFMRSEMIPSRGKFEEWWNKNKPKTIPRFPYRVYKEWVSWNDFLGNENEFGEKAGTVWRPFEEAVRWANSLKLNTYEEWMEYCKVTKPPQDVPARPDLVYDKWRSWKHWLGNTPAEMVKVAQETQKIGLFYILQDPTLPSNVFDFGVEPMGAAALAERCKKNQLWIVRAFWNEPAQAQLVKQVINSWSSPYLGDERQRIAPNIFEIITRLESILQTYRQ